MLDVELKGQDNKSTEIADRVRNDCKGKESVSTGSLSTKIISETNP